MLDPIVGQKTLDVLVLAKIIMFDMQKTSFDPKCPDGQVHQAIVASHAKLKLVAQYLSKLGLDMSMDSDTAHVDSNTLRNLPILVSKQVCYNCMRFLKHVNERTRKIAGFKFQSFESYVHRTREAIHHERELPRLSLSTLA
jgi:hypothetical protein